MAATDGVSKSIRVDASNNDDEPLSSTPAPTPVTPSQHAHSAMDSHLVTGVMVGKENPVASNIEQIIEEEEEEEEEEHVEVKANEAAKEDAGSSAPAPPATSDTNMTAPATAPAPTAPTTITTEVSKFTLQPVTLETHQQSSREQHQHQQQQQQQQQHNHTHHHHHHHHHTSSASESKATQNGSDESASGSANGSEALEIRVEEGYATRQMDEYFRQTIAAIKEELTKNLESNQHPHYRHQASAAGGGGLGGGGGGGTGALDNYYGDEYGDSESGDDYYYDPEGDSGDAATAEHNEHGELGVDDFETNSNFSASRKMRKKKMMKKKTTPASAATSAATDTTSNHPTSQTIQSAVAPSATTAAAGQSSDAPQPPPCANFKYDRLTMYKMLIMMSHRTSPSSTKRSSSSSSSSCLNSALVLIGCFLNQFIVEGLCYNYANLIELVQSEFKSSSRLVASMPGVFLVAFCLLVTPLALFLGKQVGAQRTALIGSFVSSLALFASAFVKKNIVTFTVFYGFFAGIGIGLVYVPTLLATSKWFLRRRLYANCVAVAGAGLGAALYPLLSERLLAKYELFDALFVLSGVQLNCFVGSMLLRERHSPLVDVASMARRSKTLTSTTLNNNNNNNNNVSESDTTAPAVAAAAPHTTTHTLDETNKTAKMHPRAQHPRQQYYHNINSNGNCYFYSISLRNYLFFNNNKNRKQRDSKIPSNFACSDMKC